MNERKQFWAAAYALALAHAMAKQTMEERCDMAEMHADARKHADMALAQHDEAWHYGEDD